MLSSPGNYMTLRRKKYKRLIWYIRTWFNEIGNREMYMNCASVTIGGGGARSRAMAKRAMSGPEVFKANIGNGCTTAAGTDVVFPSPGPNIQYGGNAASRAPPSGSCQEQNLS